MTKFGGKKTPDNQKEVGINIFSENYCKFTSLYNDGDIDFDAELCAGQPDKNNDGLTEKGTDSCQGKLSLLSVSK